MGNLYQTVTGRGDRCKEETVCQKVHGIIIKVKQSTGEFLSYEILGDYDGGNYQFYDNKRKENIRLKGGELYVETECWGIKATNDSDD